MRAYMQNVQAIQHRVGEEEECDKPECDEGVEERHPDPPQELVTLVEEISEMIGVEELRDLRAEAETILVLRYQSRCISKSEAVLVEWALASGSWRLGVKDAVAALVTGAFLKAPIAAPDAAGDCLESVA
ncbi:transcriptional family protein, putative [Babesia ovata]|uniref:Transcriptional family protein, putative n=1 Tax=Babesia ovata TaxID=189622 RepID=A0A2H6K951_9APIC|nr:transcriptional family protein, putative [Babesia ovata]GBE59479.1 transcriptional family protein, putative [Babesia ovata]